MLDKIEGVLQAVRAAGDGSVWKPLSMKISTGWEGGRQERSLCVPLEVDLETLTCFLLRVRASLGIG